TLRPVTGLDLIGLVAVDLEGVEQSGGAQKVMLPDPIPGPRLSHVVEPRELADQVFSAHHPSYQERRSMMLREQRIGDVLDNNLLRCDVRGIRTWSPPSP